MNIKQAELQTLMTETLRDVTKPYLEAVQEALASVARLEERTAFAERITRLETRLEQFEKIESRVRELEKRLHG